MPLRPNGQGWEPAPALLARLNDWERIRAQFRLSARETELVRHLFSGRKLEAIAREMGLRLGTVKTYSQRIHHKLGVHDRFELALTVIGARLDRP
jgi:DNA-binding NarL/FixJ family response regulator